MMARMRQCGVDQDRKREEGDCIDPTDLSTMTPFAKDLFSHFQYTLMHIVYSISSSADSYLTAYAAPACKIATPDNIYNLNGRG
jgi:hypothetical protein